MSEVLEYLDGMFNEPVMATVVVAMTGQPPVDAPLMWMDLSRAEDADLSRLGYALAIEAHYLETVLAFQEESEPSHDCPVVLPLEELAPTLDVDRLLCVVVQTAVGQIAAARNYDGIEMTRLEVIREQMDRFIDLLRGRGGMILEGHC